MTKHPNDAQREALAKIAALEAKESGGTPEEIQAAEASALAELPDAGQTMSPKDLRDVVRELRALRIASARPHPVLLAAILAGRDSELAPEDALEAAEELLAAWDRVQRDRRGAL